MAFYINQLNVSNEFFVEIVNYFEFLVQMNDHLSFYKRELKGILTANYFFS